MRTFRFLLRRFDDPSDARLITTDRHEVQVAQEALIREWDTLRDWLQGDCEGLRIHRHLTEATQACRAIEQDASELYRGPRLDQAQTWAHCRTSVGFYARK